MLIHNATVVTFDGENCGWMGLRCALMAPIIAEVGAEADSLGCARRRTLDARHVVDAGVICAPTHFYGAFARGMYIPGPLRSRTSPEILEKLWWRADKAPDLEGVRRLAEVCLVDAIRNGTTTLIDHHASQRHRRQPGRDCRMVEKPSGLRASATR